VLFNGAIHPRHRDKKARYMGASTMSDDWFHQYFDATNGHDGARVVAFMAENATYEDVALGVVHHSVVR